MRRDLNPDFQWTYRVKTNVHPESCDSLLIRMAIGEVNDGIGPETIKILLQSVQLPIKSAYPPQNCVNWIRSVLLKLRFHGYARNLHNIEMTIDRALAYADLRMSDPDNSVTVLDHLGNELVYRPYPAWSVIPWRDVFYCWILEGCVLLESLVNGVSWASWVSLDRQLFVNLNVGHWAWINYLSFKLVVYRYFIFTLTVLDDAAGLDIDWRHYHVALFYHISMDKWDSTVTKRPGIDQSADLALGICFPALIPTIQMLCSLFWWTTHVSTACWEQSELIYRISIRYRYEVQAVSIIFV